MNKAVKAIIAVILIGGALYYMYGQMQKLGYFRGAPPPRQQTAPGRPQPAPAAPNAAPEQPAPSTDTAAASQ